MLGKKTWVKVLPWYYVKTNKRTAKRTESRKISNELADEMDETLQDYLDWEGYHLPYLEQMDD